MRKKIFTFLLALVTSVGMLNAQSGGISVTQFNVPNEWESAETKLLVSDLPGFGAADSYTTQRWNEVPSGEVYLIYAFESDGRVKYHTFSDGDRYSSPTEIIGNQRFSRRVTIMELSSIIPPVLLIGVQSSYLK